MNNIFYQQKIALNEIFMELYEEKKKINKCEIGTADTPYKNFVNENTEKLKAIFKAMNFDIEQYKNNKVTYEIPIIVAEIFKIYLKEDSRKGSFISRVRGKKFLEISYGEKKDFINKVIIQLKEKFKDYANFNDELEDIRKRWISEASYNEEIKGEIIDTEIISNILIESAIINVGAISELDGLVSVENPVYEDIAENKSLDELKKINEITVPYSAKLTQEDRLELVHYLRNFIIENIKQWKKIVNIACELRESNISEYDIDDINFFDSEELVKLAIKEYENEIKTKMKAQHVVQYNPEEIQEILKNIKLEIESRKND